MSEKYFENWSNVSDVLHGFGNYNWETREPDPIEGFPTDDEILFAEYSYEDYSGYAFVLYRREGKLYEVNGSHCSCNGLEGQWEPEETTWVALAMRKFYSLSPAGESALKTLIDAAS